MGIHISERTYREKKGKGDWGNVRIGKKRETRVPKS